MELTKDDIDYIPGIINVQTLQSVEEWMNEDEKTCMEILVYETERLQGKQGDQITPEEHSMDVSCKHQLLSGCADILQHHTEDKMCTLYTYMFHRMNLLRKAHKRTNVCENIILRILHQRLVQPTDTLELPHIQLNGQPICISMRSALIFNPFMLVILSNESLSYKLNFSISVDNQNMVMYYILYQTNRLQHEHTLVLDEIMFILEDRFGFQYFVTKEYEIMRELQTFLLRVVRHYIRLFEVYENKNKNALQKNKCEQDNYFNITKSKRHMSYMLSRCIRIWSVLSSNVELHPEQEDIQEDWTRWIEHCEKNKYIK